MPSEKASASHGGLCARDDLDPLGVAKMRHGKSDRSTRWRRWGARALDRWSLNKKDGLVPMALMVPVVPVVPVAPEVPVVPLLPPSDAGRCSTRSYCPALLH
jgi:hypothetical protein